MWEIALPTVLSSLFVHHIMIWQWWDREGGREGERDIVRDRDRVYEELKKEKVHVTQETIKIALNDFNVWNWNVLVLSGAYSSAENIGLHCNENMKILFCES